VLPPDLIFGGYNAPNTTSARGFCLAQTGELTVLSQTPSWNLWILLLREG